MPERQAVGIVGGARAIAAGGRALGAIGGQVQASIELGPRTNESLIFNSYSFFVLGLCELLPPERGSVEASGRAPRRPLLAGLLALLWSVESLGFWRTPVVQLGPLHLVVPRHE